MDETVDDNKEPDRPLSELAEVRDLAAKVSALRTLELDELTRRDLLVVVRDVEVISRRLDANMNRLLDQTDKSGAFVVDGHRSAKPCIKHLGRISGPEAHGRVQTARQLRDLPAVTTAFEAGLIPTEMVRAIARVAANPRVSSFLAVADPVFAELASDMTHDAFMDWIKRWEELADTDGAAEAADTSHQRRDARVWTNSIDGTTTLTSQHAGIQGVVISEIFERFVAAEFEADLAWAREHLDDDFCIDDLPRTPAQRRADALLAVFRRAVTQPADARSPEPLVSIVIDQQTLEDEIRRAAGCHGSNDSTRDPNRADDVVCHTDTGERLHPSDALAAALVGQVRRVVIDAAGTVIDLGRRRRIFTGCARDAALMQDLIEHRANAGCRWPGCDTPHHKIQIDHRQSWGRDGPTNPANSQPLCGGHNRLKETGYTPVRGPNGTWTIRRPDKTHITPPA